MYIVPNTYLIGIREQNKKVEYFRLKDYDYKDNTLQSYLLSKAINTKLGACNIMKYQEKTKTYQKVALTKT